MDEEIRVQLLLDYAKRLPPLPPEFEARREAGENRVPECMSPVHMWMSLGEAASGGDDGSFRLHIHVGEEAPTIKGFLSILVAAYDGADPRDVGSMPANLVERLGLTGVIRMNRMIGLDAIMGRIRRGAAELASHTATGEAR